MKINNNMSAVVTNNQLLRNENDLSDVMERLSSGFKINHAKDDPSGIAISAKMQAQIDALDQASENSSNGQSVLETADSALGEVTSMLQRMRELSVQAANDVNSQTEKDAIQLEIDNLKSEIDRVSSTTEFNTKSLLDGSLDTRVYGNNVSRLQASNSVASGYYKFTVNSAATTAKVDGTNTWESLATAVNSLADGESATIEINGSSATLTKGMDVNQIYETVRNAAEIGECTISDQVNSSGLSQDISFASNTYGGDSYIEVSTDNAAIAGILGASSAGDGKWSATDIGTDARITIDRSDDASSQFDNQTAYKLEGNKITFTNTNDFELSMKLDAGFDSTTDTTGGGGEIALEVTEIGPLTLQIGANEGQTMDVQIPSISCDYLYIDEVDVSTVNGASKAIDTLDDAIARVNEIRSSLGAYENRLTHTISSLDTTDENMNSAISRIQDADMATEMVDYTRLNVLEQAATSALSQANELPQMALQLLQ